ncbi:MAG: hypothetical protein U0R69_03750 [Gaiellales bacterium]
MALGAPDGEIPQPDLFQGQISIGAGRLRKREYAHAARAFARASRLAETPNDRELARGLVHLAAAGYRGLGGDTAGRERQLAHARRRLAPFLPSARRVDVEVLLRSVEGGRGPERAG